MPAHRRDVDSYVNLDEVSLAAAGCQTAGSERCYAVFLQKDEALEVITGDLQLQDECGAYDPQTTYQFAAHLGQGAKHMLDASTRRSDTAVTLFLCLGNPFGRVTSSLDVHAPAGLLQPRFPFNVGVATIGIDVAAGIARIQQFFEDVGIGHGSMRDGDLADQLAALVDASVQLVAEGGCK